MGTVKCVKCGKWTSSPWESGWWIDLANVGGPKQESWLCSDCMFEAVVGCDLSPPVRHESGGKSVCLYGAVFARPASPLLKPGQGLAEREVMEEYCREDFVAKRIGAETRCFKCGKPHLEIHCPIKPTLTGLMRDDPKTPEGKYLVKRRDGTVPPWPSFVMGGADPIAPWALRFYATLGFLMGLLNFRTCRAQWRWAAEMVKWRKRHWTGDPGKGAHRKDDPETVAEMRKGMSA